MRGLGGGGSAASLGRPLVRRLEEAGETVFTVRQAEAFARTAPRQYTVGASPRDYELLIADLRARPAGIPRRMVHLGSLAQGPEDASPAELPEAGFYSLLFLARALAQQEPPAPCRLTVVSAQGQSVTGEEALIPANATLPGVCKVITQELPHLICRSIDVVLPAAAGPPWERLAERLLRELRADPPEPVVAYRGDRRLVAGFEPVRIPEPRGTPGLRPRGVYLITGGLGKVGLALAGYLAEAVKARLVLVGRSAFPHRDAWSSWLESHPPDNGISRKIRRLRALEQAGGEVVVERADVADPAQLKAVVARAVDRFGRLHGVVHAAAHTGAGSFATVATATREACELQFRAKVHGLCALEEALGESELDFCMLTSSLAAHLGGLGFAAYAAANRFMDAWAERHNRSHPGPWMSVNWEGWTPEAGEGFTGVGARSTISPQEGVAVFRRLLAVSGEAQVAVSTADLETRLSAARPPADAQESEVESAPADSGDDLHSRYAAPRDPVEQAVAEIWSDLLGLERVGLYDDFFELGGHSLLATRILSRVRETLRVDLPLLEFFREATVEGLSRRVKERLAGGDGDGESSQLPIGAALSREEELLEHLDQVSDETVESLLRELLAREENPG